MNDTEMLTEDEQQIVAILTAARALIQRGWTQGVLARTETGKGVNGLDPAATQWCLVGAIDRAAHDLNCFEIPARHLLNDFCPDQTRPIWQWNNDPERTQEEVLALFDQALAQYRK